MYFLLKKEIFQRQISFQGCSSTSQEFLHQLNHVASYPLLCCQVELPLDGPNLCKPGAGLAQGPNEESPGEGTCMFAVKNM